MALPILTVLWIVLVIRFLAGAGRVYGHREQLPRSEPGGALPKLSIIIPARDEEANIGECLECITALEGPERTLEVIVVDDHSTDGTAAIVDDFAARDARIRRTRPPPLPDGWTGKSNACWHGVTQASGDWLLFIDADTFLGPDAVNASLGYASNRGIGLLSVTPFQRIVSVAERLTLPGIFLRFASAIDFARVNDPDDPMAVANGQFLLFSREAYDRIGGHEAIRAEVSDDLAFARAAKRVRVDSRTVFGEDFMETRMYRSMRAIWHGFSKNAMEVMHAGSFTQVLGGAVMSFALALGVVLPPMMVVLTDTGTLNTAVALASWLVLGVLALFFVLALRALRVPAGYVLAMPVGLIAHGAILCNAWFRQRSGDRLWKGRRY